MIKRALVIFGFCAILLAPLGVGAQSSEEAALQDLEALQGQIEEFRGELQNAAQPVVDSKEIKARVNRIVSEYQKDQFSQIVFEIEYEGQTLRIDTGEAFTEGLRFRIEEGQLVYIQLLFKDGEVDQAFLVDVVRTPTLLFLFGIFCALVMAVGYWRGLQAIGGLALTMLVLFGFIVPRILNGSDPVLVTVLGGIVILAINMHLSHGFNKQTAVAFGSTSVGLLLAMVFGSLFVWMANLSGLSSEEAALLYFNTSYNQLPTGILLAGIILGAVGVLDDIAITQSETVAELLDANPSLSRAELYRRAMRVGRHHIASTVNTLVLAYAGVALPLLLLFVLTKDVSPLRFLNEELVAEEVVRTLAGTAALILTVPVSTIFATLVQKPGSSPASHHGHGGHHH